MHPAKNAGIAAAVLLTVGLLVAVWSGQRGQTTIPSTQQPTTMSDFKKPESALLQMIGMVEIL